MPGTFSDPDMHQSTCVTHLPSCMQGSLTSGFLRSRWRGRCSRHSLRMHNLQFSISGKRPMVLITKHWQDFADLASCQCYGIRESEDHGQGIWNSTVLRSSQTPFWKVEKLSNFAGNVPVVFKTKTKILYTKLIHQLSFELLFRNISTMQDAS